MVSTARYHNKIFFFFDVGATRARPHRDRNFKGINRRTNFLTLVLQANHLFGSELYTDKYKPGLSEYELIDQSIILEPGLFFTLDGTKTHWLLENDEACLQEPCICLQWDINKFPQYTDIEMLIDDICNELCINNFEFLDYDDIKYKDE